MVFYTEPSLIAWDQEGCTNGIKPAGINNVNLQDIECQPVSYPLPSFPQRLVHIRSDDHIARFRTHLLLTRSRRNSPISPAPLRWQILSVGLMLSGSSLLIS